MTDLTADDQRAAQLLDVAQDLVVRVRDDDPRAVQRYLAGLDRTDLQDIAVLLAAMVPDDRPATDLLAWWLHPPPQLRAV